MTDVLDRAAHDDAGSGEVPAAVPRRESEVTEPVRHLLAALAVGAGVIHLAMVPSHIDAWAIEGVAFAVAGWLQIAFAVLVIARPSRLLLGAAAATNLAFVGAWAVTRTFGPPGGPHSGHAESITLIDGVAVAFELAVVGLAVLALVRSRVTSPGRAGRHVPVVGVAAVAVLTSVALGSPSARDHADEAHGGHGAAAGHEEMAGEDHGDHGDAAAMESLPFAEERGLLDLRNGHHHEMAPQALDAATQAELDEQLAVTREVAAQNPTVADAMANGYRRIGPYFPGIGAHFGNTGPEQLNPSGVMDREALLHPLAIIYEGTEPTARVAGFMYLSTSETEPEGFAGPNDVWHYHEQLCLKYGSDGEIDVPFGLDKQSTEAQCSGAGGRILPISPWMVHVWSAPGYDNDPEVGTFGEVHTDLTCSDGSYHMLPIEEWVNYRLNVCEADAAD